ncbi:formylglycine-generating enzyme family protein [Chloroflexus sp.]|uniref:formylglycine-generating enzyme family protein n=1 Tax=Chloroflexus sp. TaxID=1904827 RepID=UPI0026245EDC|nr:formylglycine-generating enzyme family protein [uncultured Chloroflexus sp.]
MKHISELLPVIVLIPGQTFLMGTPARETSALARRYGGTRESYHEETPQHEVTVPAFAIAQTPLSAALYACAVAAGAVPPPPIWRGPQPPPHLSDLPVTDITWHEARAFCAWLNRQPDLALCLVDSNGQPLPPPSHLHFRLPAEAEWELAARGIDGRRFPWGDTFSPELANTRESGRAAPNPPGVYRNGRSPFGIEDMAGNVWEWTSSLDRPYPYRADDGREDPAAPGRRILRGGCYANPQGYARCACRFRLQPTMRNQFLGMRLALSIS